MTRRGETRYKREFPVDGQVCEFCGADEDILHHHKDDNYLNNDPSNIQFLCRGCHTRLHHKGKQVSEETRNKISAGAKGNQKWLGRNHTEESRKKMSESQKRRSFTRDSKGRFS